MIKIATVAMNSVFDKKANLAKYEHFIAKAAAQHAKLLVLPELSLQGFPPSMLVFDPEHNLYQHREAELVPEGSSTQLLIRKAVEHNMYICWGMFEQSHERPDIIYNSAVLVGPDGYVGTFRKVHNPLTERLYCNPGYEYPVFETGLGKIGMLICYDKSFPEPARILALKGAELILAPTAWPCSYEPTDDEPVIKLNTLFETVRAAENQVFYVASNHVGRYEGENCCGNSRIVNPQGVSLSCTNLHDEDLAIAEVDIQNEIKEARLSGAMLGSNLLKDRRPDTYGEITSISKYNFQINPKEN
jgi:predicted amidohydrolase